MSSRYARNKGRESRKYPQHLRLPSEMLQHEKFRTLSSSAVKVLLEICTRHNGFNNRKIVCSYNQLAKPLKLGKATIKKASDQLIEHGFLKITKKGYYTGRRATEWEITFLPSEGYEPTHMWKDPEQRPKRSNLEPIKQDAIQEAMRQIEPSTKKET